MGRETRSRKTGKSRLNFSIHTASPRLLRGIIVFVKEVCLR